MAAATPKCRLFRAGTTQGQIGRRFAINAKCALVESAMS